MSNLANLKHRATSYGATVRVNRQRPIDLEVIAPDGMLWAGTDLHALVAQQQTGQSAVNVYQDVMARMAGGVTKCTDQTCTTCPVEE